MSISERIRLAMREAEMSQVDLAKACGLKPPSIHGWLSGKAKFLRGENLLKAAKALGVTEEWLANGKGPMRPEEERPAPAPSGPRLTVETPEEMRLLTAFRLADDVGRDQLNAAVDAVLGRLERARRYK